MLLAPRLPSGLLRLCILDEDGVRLSGQKDVWINVDCEARAQRRALGDSEGVAMEDAAVPGTIGAIIGVALCFPLFTTGTTN